MTPRRWLLAASLLLALPAAAQQPSAPADGGTPPADQSASPPKPDAPPPPALAPQTLLTIPQGEATPILGKKVLAPDGATIGRVVDLLVDGDGRPRAAVIDFGGFLGVGSRKIAVDWQLLQFRPGEHDAPIIVGIAKTELQVAPEYKDAPQPASVVGSPSTQPAPALAPGDTAPSETK